MFDFFRITLKRINFYEWLTLPQTSPVFTVLLLKPQMSMNSVFLIFLLVSLVSSMYLKNPFSMALNHTTLKPLCYYWNQFLEPQMYMNSVFLIFLLVSLLFSFINVSQKTILNDIKPHHSKASYLKAKPF